MLQGQALRRPSAVETNEAKLLRHYSWRRQAQWQNNCTTSGDLLSCASMKHEKRVPQQRQQEKRAKVPSQPRASAAAIVFKVNVLYQNDEGKTIYLAAGQASPWTRLEDIPPRLQNHVGSPEDSVIAGSEIQRVVPRATLEQEDEVLERLNSGADLDPAVREALAERGEEYLATVRARNAALEEAAARQDIAADQVIAEHEAESLAIYEERKIL